MRTSPANAKGVKLFRISGVSSPCGDITLFLVDDIIANCSVPWLTVYPQAPSRARWLRPISTCWRQTTWSAAVWIWACPVSPSVSTDTRCRACLRTSTLTASSSPSSASPLASSQFCSLLFSRFFCGSHGDFIKNLARITNRSCRRLWLFTASRRLYFFQIKFYKINYNLLSMFCKKTTHKCF